MTTELPATTPPPPAPVPEKVEVPVEVAPEKPVDPPTVPVTETPVEKKGPKSSNDRDVALGALEKEKRLSFIKAWEETEKSKAENKAEKELAAITAWENTKKADIEAKLKQIEEKYDKKKAEYAEKMKNKVGLVHQRAEEKRAMVVAAKCEDNLKAEESAAKYRATGTVPKKLIGCFGV